MTETKRTSQQNKALHVWLRLVAECLNDAGYDMKKTLKESVDIPWNESMAKEYLYRPVMEAMTDKESTTELDTIEPSEVCKVISRHIAEKFGVVLPPFPNQYNR